jgi:hypothetical protein
MEKQFNVWSIQEELYAIHGQKQLEKRLRALRDQYIEQLIEEGQKSESKESKCEKTQKKHRCIIL